MRLADRNRVAVGEPCIAPDDAHAEAGKPLGGVNRCNLRDDIVHVRLNLGEIDAHFAGMDAEGVAAHVCGAFRCGEQSFRRHASVMEAFTAHLAALDEYGRDAERRRRGSGR